MLKIAAAQIIIMVIEIFSTGKPVLQVLLFLNFKMSVSLKNYIKLQA